MSAAIWVFWGSVLTVGYACVGYPLLARRLARKHGRTPDEDDACPSVTVVVAAYNEEARIAARVRDLLAQDYPQDRLHVLVVSDGSSDRTACEAAVDDPRVTVLSRQHNDGKAAALDAALAQVATELVAFTDARQRFAPGALRALVAPFADHNIGAVSGELALEGAHPGETSGGVGMYWRMEIQLRHDEARLGWLHGVSGGIYAMRRVLARPIPVGTILDDMWFPLQAVLAGQRVWLARGAIAYDQASTRPDEEFRRKLRTLAGNWQLIARLPVLLNPLRNPVFFAWFSHKLLRLVVPWLLIAAVVASAVASPPLYRLALAVQLVGYAAAVLALLRPRLVERIPLLPAAGAFVMLNLAALLALPAYLAWKPSRLWSKH